MEATLNFTALAIISTRNEIDILPQVIQHLRGQEIDVYLIDDWSSDGTWEQASSWDLAGLERFPADRPSQTYDWGAILRRKEDIAMRSGASWCIHHDADEIRRSVRNGETLIDALRRADAAHCNACDHELFNFSSRDGWKPGMDPEGFFYKLEARPKVDSIQIKAWKNTGQRVDLASSGGHWVQFPGRKVWDEKLILRHYPLRGSELAAWKLADRRSRWNPEERRLGWHVQYDDLIIPGPGTGLSIVTLSKFPEHLHQLSRSLDSFEPAPHQRIVVVDGDWEPPAPWARVQGITPFVFARNANLGIAAAGQDDVLLLNDDVALLHPRSLDLLRAVAQDHPRAGIVSPQFTGGVGNRLQFAGHTGPEVIISQERLCFTGVLIPRKTLTAVGALDERFIEYGCEDDDYCLRAQRLGLELLICPSVRMKHGFGAGAGKDYSATALRLMSRDQQQQSIGRMRKRLAEKYSASQDGAEKPSVHSFDLFDTLIARRSGILQNVFPIAEIWARIQPSDIVVSDTHLAEARLRELSGLSNRMFLSDHGKLDGSIWPTVLQEFHLVDHTGDSVEADVHSPQRFGIKAIHTSLAQPTGIEEGVRMVGLPGLAEAMREARLRTWHRDPTMRGLQLFQVQGNFPFLFLAAIALLRATKGRLLMSSRDCWLWQQIVRWMEPQRDVVYFETSRLARAFPTPEYLEYVNCLLPGAVVDLIGTGWSTRRLLERTRHPDAPIVLLSHIKYPPLEQTYRSLGEAKGPSHAIELTSDHWAGWSLERGNMAPHPMLYTIGRSFNPLNIAWDRIPELQVQHDAFAVAIDTLARYDFTQDLAASDGTVQAGLALCGKWMSQSLPFLKFAEAFVVKEDNAVMAELERLSRRPVTIVALAKYRDVFQAFHRNVAEFAPPWVRKILVRDGHEITDQDARGWEVIQGPAPFSVARNWNIGWRAAPADSDVMALNDDVTFLQKQTVERLQRLAYSDPKIGIVGARITLGYVGNPLQMRPRQDRELTDVKTCGNGCTYFKRTLIDKIGLFDEETFRTFYNAEDADYSWRANAAGFRVCIARDVHMKHGFGRLGNSASIQRTAPDFVQRLCPEGVAAFKRKWGHFDVLGERQETSLTADGDALARSVANA